MRQKQRCWARTPTALKHCLQMMQKPTNTDARCTLDSVLGKDDPALMVGWRKIFWAVTHNTSTPLRKSEQTIIESKQRSTNDLNFCSSLPIDFSLLLLSQYPAYERTVAKDMGLREEQEIKKSALLLLLLALVNVVQIPKRRRICSWYASDRFSILPWEQVIFSKNWIHVHLAFCY